MTRTTEETIAAAMTCNAGSIPRELAEALVEARRERDAAAAREALTDKLATDLAKADCQRWEQYREERDTAVARAERAEAALQQVIGLAEEWRAGDRVNLSDAEDVASAALAPPATETPIVGPLDPERITAAITAATAREVPKKCPATACPLCEPGFCCSCRAGHCHDAQCMADAGPSGYCPEHTPHADPFTYGESR